MISLRSRIFIIVSLVVLVILGLAVLAIIFGKNNGVPTPAPGTPAANNGPASISLPGGTTVVVNPLEQGMTARVPSTLENEQNAVRQLARVFLERYNSYSTAGGFNNLLEVKDLVTPDLWVRINGPLTKKSTSNQFTGVTTVVVSSDLSAWSDQAATVDLKVQITEDKGGIIAERPSGAQVFLVNNNDNWLVSKFVWEK